MLTMASYACNRHQGWCTQATLTKTWNLISQSCSTWNVSPSFNTARFSDFRMFLYYTAGKQKARMLLMHFQHTIEVQLYTSLHSCSTTFDLSWLSLFCLISRLSRQSLVVVWIGGQTDRSTGALLHCTYSLALGGNIGPGSLHATPLVAVSSEADHCYQWLFCSLLTAHCFPPTSEIPRKLIFYGHSYFHPTRRNMFF